jgi:hypothetical protein
MNVLLFYNIMNTYFLNGQYNVGCNKNTLVTGKVYVQKHNVDGAPVQKYCTVENQSIDTIMNGLKPLHLDYDRGDVVEIIGEDKMFLYKAFETVDDGNIFSEDVDQDFANLKGKANSVLYLTKLLPMNAIMTAIAFVLSIGALVVFFTHCMPLPLFMFGLIAVLGILGTTLGSLSLYVQKVRHHDQCTTPFSTLEKLGMVISLMAKLSVVGATMWLMFGSGASTPIMACLMLAFSVITLLLDRLIQAFPMRPIKTVELTLNSSTTILNSSTTTLCS